MSLDVLLSSNSSRGPNQQSTRFRLLNTVILVHLRGHFCIMAVCMSLHGTFASIQMFFPSK
jgi:hypothetical protein